MKPHTQQQYSESTCTCTCLRSKLLPELSYSCWGWTTALTLIVALSSPQKSIAQARPSILISPDCANLNAKHTLQQEIALRLDPADLKGWHVAWTPTHDGCVLQLFDKDLKYSAPLTKSSDNENIRDAVVGLAWFVTIHTPAQVADKASGKQPNTTAAPPVDSPGADRRVLVRAGGTLNGLIPGGSFEVGGRQGPFSMALVAEALIDAPAPGPPKHDHDVALFGLKSGWTVFMPGPWRVEAMLEGSLIQLDSGKTGQSAAQKHDSKPHFSLTASARLKYSLTDAVLFDVTFGYRHHLHNKSDGEPRLSSPVASLGAAYQWESPW